MDKLARYRDLIRQHMIDLAELFNRQPTSGVETLCVFDEQRDHYLVVSTGWAGHRRERGVTLFVRIRNGKIWIEEDWTGDGIVPALLEAGVPHEDIVLAFHAPEMRQYTDFAVA